MALPYEYCTAKMEDLLLDVNNPRFASSALVENASKSPEQKDVIKHLLIHSDVIELAQNIVKTHYLHGSEMITCYSNSYGQLIVAEGNRRTCACKLLLDRSLIPEEYRSIFPIASEETLENIRSVMINLYPNKESVQSYLSDRHISGVKKWSTLEKNNYYMNLFQQYRNIETVKTFTSDSKSKIRTCIIEYQFFMETYKVLKTNGIELEIEKIDYLPLADRFMHTLVGNDREVGLDLQIDDNLYTYLCPINKKEVYNEILLLVGKAFLLRKSSDTPPKIVGSDVSNHEKRKNLIIEDKKIPGLYELIKKYKSIDDKETTFVSPSDGNAPSSKREQEVNSTAYVPTKTGKFRPKQHKTEQLIFTKDEAKDFLFDESEQDERIKEIIIELAKLKLVDEPIACASLYRTLIEACTRRVFDKHVPSSTQEYSDSDLKSNLNYINNNIIFKGSVGSESDKLRKAIKNSFGKDGLIDILNLYIHHPKLVDTTIIANSWNTMKHFVIRCLNM